MIVQPQSIPSGFTQTEVGLLPDDWQIRLLDDVSQRGSGHTPDKKKPEYWDGGIQWISLQDTQQLDHRYISITAANISKAGLANSSAVMHPVGTVVMSRDAGVGRSAIMGQDMAVSQHFMAWRCGPELHNEFLYYWLQSQKPEFERIAMGNTIKTIGLPYFRQLKVPVPPLPEQQAISEALGDADAWIESLEGLIAKKRHLKQAAMQQLLTGKRRLPGFEGEWKSIPIGEFTSCTAGGTPRTDVPEYWGGAIRWMSSGELNSRMVYEVEGRITTEGLANSSARLLPEDCVLIGLAGQGKTRGTVAINFVKLATNQSVAAILPDPRYNSRYLYHNLDMRYEELRELSAGDGGRGGLNLTLIKNIQIPFPELREQNAIAEVLSDMDKEIISLKAKLSKARDIKQGMMQQLLTGKIRLV